MTDATPDELRSLAAWQYKWAELAGSDEERERRRKFADYLDRLAGERETGSDPSRAGVTIARTC